MGLSRKTQIAIAAEAIEGVAATITSANLVPVMADPAPSFTPNNELLRRNLATGSLSPTQGRNTFRSGTISFTMELAGPADGLPATVGAYALALEACGLARRGVTVIGGATMTTSNGMIPPGATYLQTTATGRSFQRHFDGDSYLFVDEDTYTPAAAAGDVALVFTAGASTTTTTPSSGTYTFGWGFEPASTKVSGMNCTVITGGSQALAVNDIIVGDTSGARARVTEAIDNADLPATIKYELFAQSGNFVAETFTATGTVGGATGGTLTGTENQYDIKSCTIEGRFDGVLVKIKGARGNVVFRGEAGGQMFLDFEFTGIGVQPSDGALFANPTAPALPAILVNTVLSLETDATGDIGTTLTPKWSSFSFDLGNSVELPVCPDAVAGYGPAAEITGREPSASLDPQATREAIYPFLNQDWDKSDYRLTLQTGTYVPATPTGNAFRIELPFVQTVSATPGNRLGINTYDLTMAPAVAEIANATATGAGNLLAQHGTLTDEEFKLIAY